MSEKKSSVARTRNFATVVYPESAPSNWQDILVDEKIPAFISPIHDKDMNPYGESKKAHYHVMIMFEGPKTVDQAAEVFSKIGGVGCERINSVRGYARYLCHLDNPEKCQYAKENVRALCGADYHSTIGLAIDRYVAIMDIMDFIDENNIYSYYELMKYARMERMDWFRVLCDSGTYVVKEYIKSKQWTDMGGNQNC